MSEQGLTEAENRWLTGPREAETIQPSPIVGSQGRSAEELPRFPPLRGRKPPREAPEKWELMWTEGLLGDRRKRAPQTQNLFKWESVCEIGMQQRMAMLLGTVGT